MENIEYNPNFTVSRITYLLSRQKKMKKDWLIAENKKMCLHQERHSFAMRCVYSWLSQQATTALMRHKDPKITLHYYHMDDTRLLNQYDLIW